jgi:hypothetical protein
MSNDKDDNHRGFEKLEIIKRYFSRIFTVLPKDTRERLLALKLSRQELREVKKEIAFLPIEKQNDYLDELEENE